MKARALRRELVTGLIAPVQTTRLTGGYDSYSLRQISKKISPDLYLVSSIRFLVISTELSIVNLRITKKDTFVDTL